MCFLVTNAELFKSNPTEILILSNVINVYSSL
jgi:hypothetical protein